MPKFVNRFLSQSFILETLIQFSQNFATLSKYVCRCANRSRLKLQNHCMEKTGSAHSKVDMTTCQREPHRLFSKFTDCGHIFLVIFRH